MSHDSLDQKYLKLLKEYEELKKAKSVQPAYVPRENSKCERNLSMCAASHKSLMERKNLLQQEVITLYGQWVPPKIASFFKTIIPWIKIGFKKSKYADYRLDICKKCPYLRDNTTCKICGCFMTRKVNIPGASCPLKKWVPEKT